MDFPSFFFGICKVSAADYTSPEGGGREQQSCLCQCSLNRQYMFSFTIKNYQKGSLSETPSLLRIFPHGVWLLSMAPILLSTYPGFSFAYTVVFPKPTDRALIHAYPHTDLTVPRRYTRPPWPRPRRQRPSRCRPTGRSAPCCQRSSGAEHGTHIFKKVCKFMSRICFKNI